MWANGPTSLVLFSIQSSSLEGPRFDPYPFVNPALSTQVAAHFDGHWPCLKRARFNPLSIHSTCCLIGIPVMDYDSLQYTGYNNSPIKQQQEFWTHHIRCVPLFIAGPTLPGRSLLDEFLRGQGVSSRRCGHTAEGLRRPGSRSFDHGEINGTAISPSKMSIYPAKVAIWPSSTGEQILRASLHIACTSMHLP